VRGAFFSKKYIMQSRLSVITIIPFLLICSLIYAQDAPQGGTGTWSLIFSDEFDGSTLNSQKWLAQYPPHFPNNGLSHNHRAWINPDQSTVSDGKLIITALDEKDPNSTDGTNQWASSFGYLSFDYTSGAICTYDKFTCTTGFIEGRFKVPSTLGTWPAFWTLNADKSWPPEIDILEIPADRKTHHYYYHYGSDWQNEKSWGGTHTDVDKSEDFHTYGVEWGTNYMKFYFDGQIVKGFTNKSEVSQAKDMYLIINLAVGGWAGDPPSGAVFPCSLECDWIRVWKKSTDIESHESIYPHTVNFKTSSGNNQTFQVGLSGKIRKITVTNLLGKIFTNTFNISDNQIGIIANININDVYLITFYCDNMQKTVKVVTN
jgi:beta-glucanase (GH16 family)